MDWQSEDEAPPTDVSYGTPVRRRDSAVRGRSEAPPVSLPAPVPALQLADRKQLHASLKPEMTPRSFDNWLHRAMKAYGFPQPVRIGLRSCAWSVPEVQAWLTTRPRKGVFSGVRHRRGAPPEAM